MSGLLIGLSFWGAVTVIVATLIVLVVAARRDDATWRRRGGIAAIALVIELVLVGLTFYSISSSNDPGWVF